MKITINNEEVLCNKDFTIQEEMLNTSSVILNNVYPKTWETDKDYTSRFYYPPDYSKCKIFNEVYHPEQKSTASGTSFTLNNVDLDKEYYVEDLKGQTTQSGTPTPTNPVPINTTTGRQEVVVCGKNLFRLPEASSSNNVEYTINQDGTINLSGTASANTTFYIYKSLSETNITSGNTYTLSASKPLPSGVEIRFEAYNGTGWLRHITSPLTSSVQTKTGTANLTNATQLRYAVYVASGSNSTISNLGIQLEKGSTATTYEEYKGNDYEINLGKQLLNLPDRTATSNGISYSCTDGTITLNNTATANSFINAYTSQTALYLEAGTYTLSANNPVSAGGSSGQNVIRIMKSNGSDVISGSVCTMNTINASTTFTITEAMIGFMQVRTQSGTSYTDFIIQPQLEKGTGTTYAPYKTPIELCKIGNYQDKIYKQNGNWYIYKEIGKVVLNGSETWDYQFTNGFRTNITGIKQTTNLDQSSYAISNYYKSDTQNNVANNLEYGICNRINQSQIIIKNKDMANANALKTWLQSNNTSVYYVLNTPTTTLIEDEELINQLESIRLLSGLNNVSLSSPDLPFIMDLVYNYVSAYTEEDMVFCGVVENTGNISLNPREPHYCNLQVLDFKTFLSEGETLDFVIYEKTILEAIDQVIGVIQPYGFVKGNINILHGDDVIGAYSTKDKTAYDVFNYIADITQSRWTTRMIDEDTVAIDFYDPTLMPQGTAIEYNNTWFCNNNILDMSFSYSSRDYRNKQVMLSGEVYANIETTEVITADGYQTQFNTTDKIGYVSSIKINGNPATIITKEEYDLGYEGDFIYQPGNTYFESDNLVSTGAIITIVYYAVIEGREVLLNQTEIAKINTMTNRKGVIARYENRNDATTTQELNQIGQSYLKYKGSPEVLLKVSTINNIWNIGERVSFTAPLTELTTEYMVKRKIINYITTQDNIFYTFELTSSFNSETEINYFDNQRAKTMGNIGVGEYISRNIDIENTANIVFYDLEVNEVQVEGDSTLQSTLEAPLGVE